MREERISCLSACACCFAACQSVVAATRCQTNGDKKYENFDAATRFRFASKLFRSAQPVSVAAYYCVFVPTVAARCRSSTQRAAHSSHAHTPHSVRSLFVCRSLAAWHWQSSGSGDNQPPECIARSLARTQQHCALCCVVRSLTHALLLVLCSLSTQQMAALSADLCLYIYLACALCTSAVLRAWCCRCRLRRRRRRRCRQSVSSRSVC